MAAMEAKTDYGVEDLKENMIRLFNNRESADLTLVCGSQTFKIHSFILCPRSSFFQAAFEGRFKEGLAKRIDLSEDDPHLISKLICYCYTTDYVFDRYDHTEPEGTFGFALYFHAGMYAMAEKFDLNNLKKLAQKKCVTVLRASHEPSDCVGAAGNRPLTQVLEVIRFVYSTTQKNDRGLRDLVVGHVAKHWYAFLALQQFETFMAANTEFIIEVIGAKESVCSRCEKYAAWETESCSWGSHKTLDGF